jgi:hypothetical protein
MSLRYECSAPIFAPHCDDYTKKDGCTSTRPCSYRFSPRKWSVGIDEVDELICITTEPEKYWDTYPTIPLDHRDLEGNPIFKVVKLKDKFKRKK